MVEQPAGAFLMVRRDVWNKLRGFDEQVYPVWFEDVDFCRRAVDAGCQIAYVPSVVASPCRRAIQWAKFPRAAAQPIGVLAF